MKDFHDLYSLVSPDVLGSFLAKKAVELVFHHRKTPVKKLPASFGRDALETMGKNWSAYRKKIKSKKGALKLPESIEDVVSAVNQWLDENAFFDPATF